MLVDILAKSSDAVGVVGVMLLLGAYSLLNINKLTSTSKAYLTLNLLGAILILYSLLFHWNLASVIIECAWIMISLMGIYRAYRKSSQTKNMPSNVYAFHEMKRVNH